MCRWRMPLLESRCRAAMYCEPLRLVCFEEARLVFLGKVYGIEYPDELICQTCPVVHCPVSALCLGRGNFNSYHVSAKRSALVNFLGKHLLHEHHPTVHRFGEMSSGNRLALTISALSLLTEYLMAFAPCDMVLAFAIITGKEIYSVR